MAKCKVALTIGVTYDCGDDILIQGRTVDECVVRVAEVELCSFECALLLEARMTDSVREEIERYGKTLARARTRHDPDRVEGRTGLQLPRAAGELQRLL